MTSGPLLLCLMAAFATMPLALEWFRQETASEERLGGYQ